MRKLLWIGLFVVGLWVAIAAYPGLAGRGTYDSLILNFRDEVPNAEIEAALNSWATTAAAPGLRLNSTFSDDENLYIVNGDRRLLQTLRQAPWHDQLEYAEPNYQYHALTAPNDPDYAKQWNLRAISLEPAWAETQGEGAIVAVIDTGITVVPDLAETRFVPGYDFVNDRDEAQDDNGHGTHVAGTIAQSTNNGFGVAGIAYRASLMPLKVLARSGGGTVADIAEAIHFAADHGADVINLSLGGAGASDLLAEATSYAAAKGVVIIAAAGNENRNAAAFPARYPDVLAVAAVDASGQKAPYSNYGAGVDIAAPGGTIQDESGAGGILQHTLDPQTGTPQFLALQGTSMAAPHVAGVAALVKSLGITDPAEVVSILQRSARTMPEDTLNHYGAGQLDAAAAVQLALHGQISGRDFFRWLQRHGYLNLKFWFDGGVPALLPKVLMVLGSYLLAWVLRTYVPLAWTGWLASGLVMGSAGWFPLRGLYLWDLPQWPCRWLGSAIAEWGSVIPGTSSLNPFFASALIPFLGVAFFLGHPQGKGFVVGLCLGMTVFLGVMAVIDPQLLWLGQGLLARLFLLLNALACYGLAVISAKTEVTTA